MPSSLSRRLSASDAAFLYLERSNTPLHIGSLGIYEGRIPFERFVDHIYSRLPNIPRYRQRVAEVPFALAHPTWEDDPGFDITNHIRLSTLPAPGDMTQLAELTADIAAKPLDRGQPLWEMNIIHGLEGGRTGLVTKVHHAMVDGVSGIDLLMQTVDITPEPAPPPEAVDWNPMPLPTPTARMNEAFWEGLNQQRTQWQEFQQSLANPQPRLREAEALFRAARSAAPWLGRPAPRTPFAVSLSRRRRVAFSDMSFAEIRDIRTTLGGTVNDVVLAVLAGALRKYLGEHGHKTDGLFLRVAIPVNIRLEDKQGGLGNQVSAMVVELPIGEADAARRLEAIRERVDQLKSENQAGAVELLTRASSNLPVPLQMAQGALAVNTAINLICTNVPGPMIPLYCVGHLLLDHFPLVPLSLGMGLGAGVTSYNQRLFFGMMVDPQAVPDISRLGECVDESFLELRDAAGVKPSDLPSMNGTSKDTTTPPAERAKTATTGD